MNCSDLIYSDLVNPVNPVNYLTATKVDLGLLLNFGPSVQVKRKFREYKPKGSLLNAILPQGDST